MLTRRAVNTGLASLVALAWGVPSTGAAAQAPEADFAARLQRDLDAAVRPGCGDTRLTLARFTVARTATGARTAFRMDAVVRMDWPPGMRQRPFLFYAPDPEQTYAGLRARVLAEFAAAHPGCIAAV
jgi:hypothetical protein